MTLAVLTADRYLKLLAHFERTIAILIDIATAAAIFIDTLQYIAIRYWPILLQYIFAQYIFPKVSTSGSAAGDPL